MRVKGQSRQISVQRSDAFHTYLPQPHNNWILIQIVFLAGSDFNRKNAKHILDVGSMDGDLWGPRGYQHRSEDRCGNHSGDFDGISYFARTFTLAFLITLQCGPIQTCQRCMKKRVIWGISGANLIVIVNQTQTTSINFSRVDSLSLE